MALHTHRSEQLDPLVAGLAEMLALPGDDPFAEEVVAVPARGMERWLAQRLSLVLGAGSGRTDGVCAGVRFPLLADLVLEAARGGSGDGTSEEVWSTEALRWPLVAALDEVRDDPGCASLRAYLDDEGPGAPGGRRVTTAMRMARIFQAYAAERPDMVVRWAQGYDIGPDGRPLPPDAAWQPILWRAVRRRIAVPSPAELLERTCAFLRDRGAGLPGRISLIGVTRLSERDLRILSALAARHEVHLWLPHPSPALWDRMAADPSLARTRLRHGHPADRVPRNRLLASLGRESRELHVRLASSFPPELVDTDRHLPVAGPDGTTVLRRLQQVLRDDAAGPATAGRIPGDSSIQVHACHGPQRQVEVLREVVLGLLADDPSLEPRDVLVMCPRVADHAPLLTAAFGLAATPSDDQPPAHPSHRLRLSVADRSPVPTNPVLDVLSRLMALPDGRVTAADLLDLLALPPVAARFGLDAEALERIRRWIPDAGARWGLDADDRARFGLRGVSANTWHSGVDRIVLGVAMAEPALSWTLPLDDVGSADVEIVGALTEYVSRVRRYVAEARDTRTPTGWAELLVTTVAGLTYLDSASEWQASQVRRVVGDALPSAGALDAPDVRLSHPEVRALLADRLVDRPTSTGFRTGALTVCTMVPMRSVPHRVVCLLGLDDSSFPRAGVRDGDDVLSGQPEIGDRDPRMEDRQLLLDAVLAARDTLVVVTTGRDPRTNAPVPPCVPLGELLDTLAELGAPDVVVHHPLQPFDGRNFTGGALGRAGPFSFDARALPAARAPRRAPERRSFLDRPLPPLPPGPVDIDDLIAFVGNPVKAFLRRRLGVVVLGSEEELPDRIPLEVVGLEEWQVGDRLLRALLAGTDAGEAAAAERARGTLPPGRLAEGPLRRIGPAAMEVAARSLQERGDREPRTIPVSVALEAGEVVGFVPGVHGTTVVTETYSRLKPEAQLRAWVRVLALSVAQPDAGWTSATVARNPQARSSRLAVSHVVHPLDRSEAKHELDRLVSLYHVGMRTPLPYGPKAGDAFVVARRLDQARDKALTSAAKAWSHAWGKGPRTDLEDAYIARVWEGTNLSEVAAMTPESLGLMGPPKPFQAGESVFEGVADMLLGSVAGHGTVRTS